MPTLWQIELTFMSDSVSNLHACLIFNILKNAKGECPVFCLKRAERYDAENPVYSESIERVTVRSIFSSR